MARVANPKRILVRNALAYIEQKIHEANQKLVDELNQEGKFSTAYVSGTDASAKTNVGESVKMFRWLLGYLNISPIPTAYTDAQVDAIDINIRTFDDNQ